LLITSGCLRNTQRCNREERTLHQRLQKQHHCTEVVPETSKFVLENCMGMFQN
jgi:hypothetical protein